MEYFNSLENDTMSIMDTIDSMSNEERHQLDLFLNSDRQDCAMDINLKSEPSCGLPDLDHLDSTADYNNLQWLPSSNGLPGFQDENESENTDPNLLVNPQTVIPVDLFVNQNNTTSVNSTLANINGVSDNLLTSTIAQITSQNNIHIVTVSTPGLNVMAHSDPNNTVRYETVNFPKTIMSPSQSSPVLVGHLQNSVPPSRPVISLPAVQSAIEQGQEDEKKKQEKVFPKPVYSYSCLIALALKNSDNGNLPVSEIYTFMIENYPYFKTAPDGWKNSVRHNLSLNKCFKKADTPKNSSTAKKGCLWELNPAKVEKMEEEIVKWRQKDPQTLHHSMAFPEKLELIESGRAGIGSSKTTSTSSTITPITVNIPETVQSLQHPSTPTRHTPNHHHQPSTPTRLPSTPTNRIPSTPNHLQTTPTHHSHNDIFMSDIHDIQLNSQFGVDPALSELATGLWDDDINCDLGLDLANPPLCIATIASPMGSCHSPIPQQPSTPSAGYFDDRSTSYHGTMFYSSPVQLGSPSTLPNNFLYATPSPRTLFA